MSNDMHPLREFDEWIEGYDVCRKKIGRILESYGWTQGVKIVRSTKK